MPLDQLYPPAQYGWGWILLAFGILLAVILGAVLVLFFTRPKKAVEAAAGPEGPLLATEVITQLRAEYLAEIDRLQAEHAAGRLSGREINRQLSATVRRFVNEYSGLEAPVLALDDLRRAGVSPALVDALGRHYYPSIFRRDHVVDPAAGAEAARRVVHTWH